MSSENHRAIAKNSLLVAIMSNRKYWIVFFLFIASFTIRLINATSIPLIGDEFGSLREAKNFSNFNGILYFVFLKIWGGVGNSVLWYRLPSIILGSLAVVAFWSWLQRIRNQQIATLSSIFFILAPFAIEYSQNVRFYALFMFSSILFIYVYWHFSVTKKTVWNWFLLIATAGIVLASQFMGILVVGFTLIHATYFTFRAPKLRLILFLIIGSTGLIVFLLLLSPVLFGKIYVLVRSLSASDQITSYPGGRGLSLITLGKLGVLYSTFIYGSSVYPFDLILTLPTTIFILLIGSIGIFRLFQLPDKRHFAFAILLTIGPVTGLYVIFDTLWPITSRDSATPRYIIFVLPILLWILTEGVCAMSRRISRYLAFGLIVSILIIGINNLYTSYWSMSNRPHDLYGILENIKEISQTESLTVVADGRSVDTINYYLADKVPNTRIFDPTESSEKLFSFLSQGGSVAFFNADDRHDLQCKYNHTLQEISSTYQETSALVNFPYFIYTFDLDKSSKENLRSFGQIPIPHALYSTEFSDLVLPQQVMWNNKNYAISGSYSLPTCDSLTIMQIDNLEHLSVHKLILFSNFLNTNHIIDGALVANLVVKSGDSQTTLALRKGYETQAWDVQNCLANCRSVLNWHKRIGLLGASAYSDAYRDFTANIWGSEISLTSNYIDGIRVELLDPSITFYIWGMYFN